MTAAALDPTCPRCHGRLLNSTGGDFCPRCQKLATDMPVRTRREAVQSVQASAGGIGGIRSVTFELPLPLPGCSKNAHQRHWAVKGRAVAAYRAECGAMLPTILAPHRMQRARISMTFYLAPAPTRYHPRDRQNAIDAVIGLVDEIVARGWLPDDSARYLEWGPVELLSTAKDHQGRACIVVTLEAVTA